MVGRGAPSPICGIDRRIYTGGVSLAFCDGAGATKAFLLTGFIGYWASHFVKGRSRYIPDQVRDCLEFVAIVQLVDLHPVIVLSTRRLALLLLSFLH